MGNNPSDVRASESAELDLHVRQDTRAREGFSDHESRARRTQSHSSTNTRLAEPGREGLDGGAKQDAARANAQGVELLRQQLHEDAVRQFKAALSYEPGSVQILNNIGLAYAKMQDFSSAYEWYEKAYKHDTSDVETLFSLAWVERKRQRYHHAKELFQKVLDMQPEHVKALYLLGDILKTSHDYDGAVQRFERLVRLDPGSVDGHISLAQCYEHRKHYARAAQLYAHVLHLAPSRLDVTFFAGRVHYLAKQYKQAIAHFDRVPDSDARAFEARTYGAKAYRELEEHERAISCAERAAQFRPHPDVMHFLGEEYLRLNDVQKAAHWFGRALDMEPNHVGSLLELGQLMYRESRWQEAEKYFTRLCDLDRTSVVAVRFLALVKYKQRKMESCKQCCEATLRLDPLNSDVLWILAELQRHESDPDDRWFLTLHSEAPTAEICQSIAKGYLVRKQVNQASSWLQKVLQFSPNDSRVRDAAKLLARQGGAVNPQEVLDLLDHRTASASPGGQDMDLSSPSSLSSGKPQRWKLGMDEKRGDLSVLPRGGGYPEPEQKGLGRVMEPNASEDLERLLRRAERASARLGIPGADRAAEQQWQELLTAAKASLRRRPEDPLALRCAARALLSLAGDASEIRDYARRATELGEESNGFTLGYELHAYLAAAHERERDVPAAERHFAAALSSKPGDEQAMLGLARMLQQRKETTKARQLYEQVSASNSNCSESQLRLAEMSLEAGDYGDAYRCAVRASKLAPLDGAALLCLGRACAKTGRSDEAVRALESGLALQPMDAPAMQLLAGLLRKAGRDAEAVSWFKKVLDMRPGDYDCSLNLGQLHAAKGPGGASQAIHYLRSALQCRPSGKEAQEIYLQLASLQCSVSAWKDAQQTLEAAVRDHQDEPELWQKLLTVYEHLQDQPGQQQCHRRLVQLNGTNSSKRTSYGELLLSEGQLEEARQQFELVLQSDPNNTTVMLKLATAWRQDAGKEGHLEEARKGFEQVLQQAPTNADALEGAAYCHRKANNLDQAIHLYQQCLKVRPVAEGPLYYLGDLLYRQHRHAECQHYLGRLVETNCSADYKTGALYLLAKSHVSLDEYEEAERHARAGLAMKPNHPHFLFILALVKNRMADYDASVATLKQALQHCDQAESDQLRVEIHDWLAQAHERRREYLPAMAELDIALGRDPSHVSSLITRGLVHIQLKQLEQAETAFKRALAVEKNHALALVRLGYCKLLVNDHHEATQLFQRALQQRCGTVALPRSVKGSARIYMALSLMGQSDVDGALAQLAEAKKSHRNFSSVCASGRDVIVKGECEGLVQKLRNISDLDVNLAQAWQLVHLLAKELELDLREGPAAAGGGAPSAAKAASAATTPTGGAGPSAEAKAAPPARAAAVASAPPRASPPSSSRGKLGSAAIASAAPPPLASQAPAADRYRASPHAAPPPHHASPLVESPERRRWAVEPAPAAPPAESHERRRWLPEPSPSQKQGATPCAAQPAQERRQWTAAAAAAPAASASGGGGSGASTASARGGSQNLLRLHKHEQIDVSTLTQNECLGTGGFGAVYRGLFENKEVAIKKLFCEEGGDISPLQLEELEKEVAALRNLDHPRLVSFVGACLQPPNLCIVTEYMPGGSLHFLLHKARTPLVLGQQAKLALQVCEGVAFLHSQTPPVVHRDLKSLNIVLDLVYNAKICDFGLTQSMEKTHISLKDGGNGGSPRYMAPECYDCKGKITEKVDVWAMGCILVEAFGGPLPYDDCNNIQQIVAKVLIDKQLPYIPHHLPKGVRPIVEDCFHFDIKQRISAPDVFSRLRRLHLVPMGGE